MGGLTKQVVEIHIPSELGYEKIPMAAVAVSTRKMGFAQEQIDNLKLAIAEAVTNAIEHGNQGKSELDVHIILTIQKKTLTLYVIDHAQKPIPQMPTERKSRPDNRGWGMSLIKKFMDEVTITATPERNEIKMVAYLK